MRDFTTLDPTCDAEPPIVLLEPHCPKSFSPTRRRLHDRPFS